jgi:shikimate kinase
MKIIALFGITCVGKTTIGKILSEKLGYAFIDLDAEIKKYYNDTLDNIYRDCIFPMQKDEKKSIVLSRVIAKCKSNTVLAMSPMYYYTKYRQLIKSRDIICIELRDKPGFIAKRMFVYDDNDEIIEGVYNYKENLSDAKYYISRYKNTFNRHIELKYEIDGKTALDAANDLADVLDSYTNNGILHYQYLHETKNSKYDDNVINFIVKKAIAEKSILKYLKTVYDDKVSIKKFASDIFHAHDKYLILTDEEDFICDE